MKLFARIAATLAVALALGVAGAGTALAHGGHHHHHHHHAMHHAPPYGY